MSRLYIFRDAWVVSADGPISSGLRFAWGVEGDGQLNLQPR